MTISTLRWACLMSIFLLSTFQSLGQQKFSEKEIKIQELFIEANKEKLLNHLDKAIELYNSILKEDPANHTAAYELARVYILNEEFSKGQEWAQKAVKLYPENIWYLRFLVNVYEENTQYEEAAELFENITKAEPNKEDNYLSWAAFLLKANQPTDALDVYDEAEQKFGISERLAKIKSTIYQSINKPKKAEKELLKLIEAFPGDINHLELLALFYERNNQATEANGVYNKILDLDPDNIKAQMALAGKSSVAKDELAYLESLKPVFEAPDESITIKIKQILLGINKVADNGKAEAKLAQKLLELTEILETVHEQEAQGFAASGDLLYQMENFEKAKQKYKEALKRNETVFSVWEQLMRVELKLRDFKALYESSLEAMDIFPNQPIIYYYNGLAAYNGQAFDETLSVLDQALLMSEGNVGLSLEIQILLGKTWLALGDKQAFSDAFKKALQLSPDNPAVMSSYAYELANANTRLEEAEEMANAALKKEKDNPVYKHVLGWTLFKKGDFKTSASLLKEALDGNLANDPILLEHYGDALFQNGQVDQATEYWQKAQQQGNQSPLLKKKIAEKKLYE